MRFLALAFCLVTILPSALSAQELYFTILDSIDINPRCMTLVDFDGDGLDENPRRHRQHRHGD